MRVCRSSPSTIQPGGGLRFATGGGAPKLLKIAGAGEVLLLKIADCEVLGEQEHLGRRGGEAGEVLLLQIAGGEVLELSGVQGHLAAPSRRDRHRPLAGADREGRRRSGRARLEREWGVMPWASRNRVGGGNERHLGEEHAGKINWGRAVGGDAGKKAGRGKIDRGRSRFRFRGIDVNSCYFHLVGTRP